MKRIFQIILVIILIPFAIYFWPSSYGGDTTIMMVQGQSMLPTILPGSLVVAKSAPEYHIGDIVAYEQREGSASKMIVHRIVDVEEQGFVIQGDNNPKKDAGFPTEDVILGKVLFSTPYVGDLIGFFREPFVLVLSAVVLFGIQMEQKRRKERKEKKRCLRLGIPYVPPKLRNAPKKAKKPDYSMFYTAIFINILTYILIQISIANGIRIEGDILTGFLYRGIVASLASTLIFTFYFGIIFGLFFLAKSSQHKISRTMYNNYTYKQSQRLIQKRKTNHMLSVATTGWLLFIMLSLFHLMQLAGNLTPLV